MNPRSFHDGKVQLYAGDCMEILGELPENSIDAVCTDPPYHLTSIVKRFGNANAAPAKGNEAFIRFSKGFMGKQWDGGDIAFRPELWAEVLRVLKPGGHMVCFGGTRTYHRMVCAIEDAGFEVRDQVAWVYGSGFPKSHDAAQSIEKLLTTGKSRRPDRDLGGLDRNRFSGSTEGTLIADTGGRVELTTPEAIAFRGWGTALKPAFEPICLARKPLSEGTVASNVLEHGVGALNIDSCRVPTGDSLGGGDQNAKTKVKVEGWDRPWMQDAEAKAAHAERVNTNVAKAESLGRWPANLCHDGSPEVLAGFPEVSGLVGMTRTVGGSLYSPDYPQSFSGGTKDSGSAARFFYTAKADADDRLGSKHPTVKPVDLICWLIRLICPKGGTCLDPFAGTGTTGAAAFIEGCRAVLIEREAEYLADIERRMELLLSGSDERSWKLAKPESLEALPLFALTEPAA